MTELSPMEGRGLGVDRTRLYSVGMSNGGF